MVNLTSDAKLAIDSYFNSKLSKYLAIFGVANVIAIAGLMYSVWQGALETAQNSVQTALASEYGKEIKAYKDIIEAELKYSQSVLNESQLQTGQIQQKVSRIASEISESEKSISDMRQKIKKATSGDLATLSAILNNKNLKNLSRIDQKYLELSEKIASSIKECRICFKEIEGSNQCQRNRNSCGGWTSVNNQGGWTAPFRDDTDGRGGGCTYQWKLECK